MGGKYTIIGRDYDNINLVKMYEYTNNAFKAIYLGIKAKIKYDFVVIEIRKWD